MNRTLGFFLGSAVVFGLLVLILGQPVSLAPPVNRDIHVRTDTTTTPIRIPKPVRVEQAIRLPSDQTSVSNASTPESSPPAKQVVVATPSAPPIEAQPRQATVVQPVKVPVVVEYQDENKLAESWLKTKAETTQPVADLAEFDTTTDTTTVGLDKNTLAADSDPLLLPARSETPMEWFPVWDPFHSELSANAFARRLERVTGLDYRVIKTAPAQYRVVMGYSSEEQRSANLSLIEQATGLSITGGSL